MINRRNFIHSLCSMAGSLLLASTGFGRSNTEKSRNSLSLIIDADTANEIDDLFAIARGLIEPNLKIEGITSSQWHTSPKAPNDSVARSHQMNREITELMEMTEMPLAMGANTPLVNKVQPQESQAAEFIIEKAMAVPVNQKLEIAVLGPCTNVASAVLMEPGIISKISVSYIGFWHNHQTNTWNKREFNTNNDPNAVNVLLDTNGLEFNVMTASTSQYLVFLKEEVDQHLKGEGGIGDYLVRRWETYDRHWQKEDPEKTRWIMWDVAIIEALANPMLAKKELVKIPHDNLMRDIYAYTSIDVEAMKQSYWSALDSFVKKSVK